MTTADLTSDTRADLPTYTVRDVTQGADSHETAETAETAEAAAEAYAANYSGDGSWSTWWARIEVTAPDGGQTAHVIAIDPHEPACSHDGGSHAWDQGGPWGGDNGGVAWSSTCRYCRLTKHEQSRGSCAVTGQAMGPSVRYQPAQ
jgi:hypothetical protein